MFNAFISYSHSTDDKFALALQNALQKFVKPWHKKRSLEIFRDESSLSASPQLWENITKALDVSEYLILLASPLSEKSPWVNKEVKYWLEHKSIDTLLIALTEGEINWDSKNNKFLNPDNNSLPPALDNVFNDEPFYVDLRQSKANDSLLLKENLTLDNPVFKKEIIKLAAKLHGKSPNDLVSEEVTLHRKTIRRRNSVIATLSLLFIAATGLGYIANEKRKEANNKTELARIETQNKQKALDSINEFLKKSVGKRYQGGIIFYSDSTRQRGLIVALNDFESTYNWEDAKKKCEEYVVTDEEGITRDDWYLPSKEELGLLYTNRYYANFDGKFNWNGFYWSSTRDELKSHLAWVTPFYRDKQYEFTAYIDNKNGHVRAIRAFKP